MKPRKTCRVCEGTLEDVISLGEIHVSNFPRPEELDGIRAPLDVMLCSQCRLLQLRHTVPPDSLYRNYWYRSGTNKTMRSALADIATKAERLVHLNPADSVLDIGCNDGTLLAAYRTPELFKIGFDPAENLSELSRKVADKVVVDFFSKDAFYSDSELAARRPKVVTSIAMFYDLEDPKEFVSHVKDVLHPEGLWVIQMSYLPLMLSQHEFGNICHEHLEYYSLQSLEYLLSLFEFEVVGMELNDVNGGSFRVYVRNKTANDHLFADETYRRLALERVDEFRRREAEGGLDTMSPYELFAFWVERIKNDLVDFISTEAKSGKLIHVYGASTKGNTILQYCELDSSLIPAAAERNPEKWGRQTVGTRIPIISEAESRKARPDYYLVLPWHFMEEFRDREIEFLRSGGRFILPMPHITLV